VLLSPPRPAAGLLGRGSGSLQRRLDRGPVPSRCPQVCPVALFARWARTGPHVPFTAVPRAGRCPHAAGVPQPALGSRVPRAPVWWQAGGFCGGCLQRNFTGRRKIYPVVWPVETPFPEAGAWVVVLCPVRVLLVVSAQDSFVLPR